MYKAKGIHHQQTNTRSTGSLLNSQKTGYIPDANQEGTSHINYDRSLTWNTEHDKEKSRPRKEVNVRFVQAGKS